MGRSALAAALAVLTLALGGCGSGTGSRPRLTVAAAASLRAPLERYAGQFPQAVVRYSFAGSDMLAAQIEQGATPDVFASASTKLTDLLHAKHLVLAPTTFAANRLVLAVPAHGARIKSFAALGRGGFTLAIGSPSVPIGSYTRQVLVRLGGGAARRILAEVRSEEPDVSGIVGKLTEGAVDAGFTYVTDVQAAGGALRALPLPPALQPLVAYGAAVVRGAAHPAQARAFISGLLHGSGRADLLQAGFLSPRR